MNLKKQTVRFLKVPGNQWVASNGISLVPVIAASGFAAAVAQIILLRELMVLFYGIELCIGMVLATWLLAGALGCRLSAGLAARVPAKGLVYGLAMVTALILPSTLLLIRASSRLWGLVPGNIPALTDLLQICLTATFPSAFISGALFGLCWSFSQKAGAIPIKIYAGEALGATAGGLFFYLLVVTHQSTLAILLLTSLGPLSAVVWSAVFGPIRRKRLLISGTLAVTLMAVFFFHGKLDHASRRWQWGADFLAARDTPYGSVVALYRDQQYSVFTSGLWSFSSPDRQSIEYAVHPALLQHPAPQSVLVLGGVPSGLPEEILRHPSVRNVTAVELDAALVDFTSIYLLKEKAEHVIESKIHLQYQDAAEFLQTGHELYDVILMNMGDPINAQLNRFYTASFFTAVKSRLAPSGIFSFGVSGGEEMLGEVQIQFLGTIYRTLGRIFSTVSVLPGDQVRFFAADGETKLINDPFVLSNRIRQRGLDLSYVRQDTLQDSFETLRLRYFSAVLQDTPADRINRDFTPLCYTHALRLWAQQWHPLLGKFVQSITRISPKLLWIFFLSFCMLSLIIFLTGKCRSRLTICQSVAVVGGLSMVVQMGMLIVFQILQGALFLHLALIVALFMAGLAGGAACMSLKTRGVGEELQAGKLLIRVQILICIFPCVLAGLFLLLHGPFRDATGWWNLPVVLFPVLSFITGLLEGMHFSAATAVMAELEQPVSAIGGRLYAFDLLGSASGLLAATFLLIPILGPVQLLPMLSIAAIASLALLPAGLKKSG